MNKLITVDEAASIEAIINGTQNKDLKTVLLTLMGAHHSNTLHELAGCCAAFSSERWYAIITKNGGVGK